MYYMELNTRLRLMRNGLLSVSINDENGVPIKNSIHETEEYKNIIETMEQKKLIKKQSCTGE